MSEVIDMTGYKHPDEQRYNLEITKHNNGFYTLMYPDEAWEFYGTKEEILTEISEHMENMKGE